MYVYSLARFVGTKMNKKYFKIFSIIKSFSHNVNTLIFINKVKCQTKSILDQWFKQSFGNVLKIEI